MVFLSSSPPYPLHLLTLPDPHLLTFSLSLSYKKPTQNRTKQTKNNTKLETIIYKQNTSMIKNQKKRKGKNAPNIMRQKEKSPKIPLSSSTAGPGACP